MAKVSVIVPVYNAERHLDQCLDSIERQTLSDIEIICINDGSTDNSPEILARRSANDARYQLLSQENLYAGVARNAGMKIATGKYLVFWDADDYFRPDALEKMHERCEEESADLCVCGASRYYEHLSKEINVDAYVIKKYLPERLPFSRETAPGYILNFTNEAPWNKMFRRSFIEDERLEFQPTRNGNDLYFVSCALCLAKRISIVNEHLVCYRTMQKNSLVSTLSHNPIGPFGQWVDVRSELLKRNALPSDSFDRKSAAVVFYLLRNINAWESFKQAIAYLKTSGLDGLGISELHEPDFYLAAWHRECLAHLMADTPEEFLSHLAFQGYTQQRSLIAQKSLLIEQRKRLREEVSELKHENESLKNLLQDSAARRAGGPGKLTRALANLKHPR